MSNIELFKNNFENLESIWQVDENGIEFIYARDLQKVLGYEKWQKFEEVIKTQFKLMIRVKYTR